MNSCLRLCFLIFCGILLEVNATNPCNSKIIEKIHETRGCLKNVLQQTHAGSPYKVVAAPEGEIPSTLKCVSPSVEKPSSGQADVTTTYYLTNGSQFQINYVQKEQSCGLVYEYDTNGRLYELYFLSASPVPCYYRCSSDDITGNDSAYCAIPADSTDSSLQSTLKEHLASLKKAGITNMRTITPSCPF